MTNKPKPVAPADPLPMGPGPESDEIGEFPCE